MLNIYVPQIINANGFGNPMSFSLSSPRGWHISFLLKCFNNNVYSRWPWNFGQMLMSPSGWTLWQHFMITFSKLIMFQLTPAVLSVHSTFLLPIHTHTHTPAYWWKPCMVLAEPSGAIWGSVRVQGHQPSLTLPLVEDAPCLLSHGCQF